MAVKTIINGNAQISTPNESVNNEIENNKADTAVA
jgi:hypothetical protein